MRCAHCAYEATSSHGLRQHVLFHHTEKTIACPQCDYRCHRLCDLRRHQKYKHEANQRLLRCSECEFGTNNPCTLKRHIITQHEKNPSMFHCTMCDYQCKLKNMLKSHMTLVHKVNSKRFECSICPKTYNSRQNLRNHLSFAHNIGVKWHACDRCNYRAKSSSHLKKHVRNVHDVGNLKCDICYRNDCGRVREHMGAKVCRSCCAYYNIKKERIELKYVAELKKRLPFPFDHDTMLHGGACTRYRPDLIFLDAKKKIFLQVEIDEYQHDWRHNSYSCEEKRISDIYDEFKDDVPEHYVIVRFNPDGYGNKTVKRTKVFKKRLGKLVDTINRVVAQPPEEKIHIVYLYYDKSNTKIAKNIPHSFVY